MYRLFSNHSRLFLVVGLIVTALTLLSCSAPRLERTAPLCPLPTPPTCESTITTAPTTNPYVKIQPVPSLSSADKEEFFDGTRTVIGSSFADAKESPVYSYTASIANHWTGHYSDVVLGSKKWYFFASDNTETGHTDIFYASANAPTQYKPLYGVNSPCDELSPWVDPASSILYFSSPAFGTLGGYDIHSATLNVQADTLFASNINNIGQPFNSTADDLFYNTNGDSAFISSNRKSLKDFDVYSVVGIAHSPKAVQQQTAKIEGYVKNEQTQEPIADATVTAKSSKTQTIIATTTTDTSGKYVIEVPVNTKVHIVAEAPGVFFDSYTTSIPKEQANQTVVQPEPLSLPLTFVLRVNFPTAIFKDPYEFTLDENGNDTETLWQDMVQQLAQNVMGAKGTSKLILIGHTDDVGTDASNMVLGKQRVEFIIDRLVDNGVPREMMEGRSAGESLTPDRRKNEDITQWRKRCRRVELVRVVR